MSSASSQCSALALEAPQTRCHQTLSSYELIWQELPWKLQYLLSQFHPQGQACWPCLLLPLQSP